MINFVITMLGILVSWSFCHHLLWWKQWMALLRALLDVNFQVTVVSVLMFERSFMMDCPIWSINCFWITILDQMSTLGKKTCSILNFFGKCYFDHKGMDCISVRFLHVTDSSQSRRWKGWQMAWELGNSRLVACQISVLRCSNISNSWVSYWSWSTSFVAGAVHRLCIAVLW